MEVPVKELDTAYKELLNRMAHVFPSKRGYNTAKKYLRGLLSPIERKNGWQMAEAVGEKTPYVLQQFLYRGQYSADKLRDCLRDSYDKHTEELRANIKRIKAENTKANTEYESLKAEVIKAVQSKSQMPMDVLSELVNESRDKHLVLISASLHKSNKPQG